MHLSWGGELLFTTNCILLDGKKKVIKSNSKNKVTKLNSKYNDMEIYIYIYIYIYIQNF